MGRISFGDNVLWWCKIYTRNNKNEDELRERDALNIRFDVFVRNSPEYNTIASSTIEFYGYVWNEIIFYYRIYVRKQDQRLTRTPIICNVHVTFDANVYVHIPFDEQQKLCSYSNTIGTCGLFCILDEFRFFFLLQFVQLIFKMMNSNVWNLPRQLSELNLKIRRMKMRKWNAKLKPKQFPKINRRSCVTITCSPLTLSEVKFHRSPQWRFLVFDSIFNWSKQKWWHSKFR